MDSTDVFWEDLIAADLSKHSLVATPAPLPLTYSPRKFKRGYLWMKTRVPMN
jgi:hypothetical protein